MPSGQSEACVCVRESSSEPLPITPVWDSFPGVCLLTGSYDGGAGVSILRARGGALPVAVVLIGCHACVTFKGIALTERTIEHIIGEVIPVDEITISSF